MRMRTSAEISLWQKEWAYFSFGFIITLGLWVHVFSFAHIERILRRVQLSSEDFEGCLQPVEVTASQRSQNMFYHQSPGHFLSSSMAVWNRLRGTQEWWFSFYTSLTISFSSHSVFSGIHNKLRCFNYYVY